MALDLGPLPNFNVQVPDLTQKALEGAQLRNMLSEMALRKALAPGQIQLQQQQVQAATTENEMKAMQLQGQRAMTDWLTNGDASADVPAENFSSNDKIATFVGVTPNDPIMNVIRSMAQHHVPAPMLVTEAQGMLQRRNEYYKGTKEEQDAQKAERTIWQDTLASLHEMPVDQRSAQLAAKLPLLQENSKTDPLLARYAQGLAGHPELIDQAYNMLSAENQALNLRKGRAEATEKEQKVVQPGQAMSTEQRADIAKVVEIAKQEQPLKIAQVKAEAEARQQAMQGDPNAAGQLLASGSLTLADLKTRGTTPKFIEQATAAAQKINPTYNPADEIIAEHVAKSPAANQFFGSANSLIEKGGTLDKLTELGKNIPQHDFPVLNTVDDWQKLARGKGPLAGYAAMALGVADDYGKVMGGGNASDSARNEALSLFAKNASPEMRQQAIDATRAAVLSQRNARIGANQFLRREYGSGELGGQSAPQHVPGGQAQGLKEGATGTGSNGQKYIVKGGVWVPQP